MNIGIADDHAAIPIGIKGALPEILDGSKLNIVGIYANGKQLIDRAPFDQIDILFLDVQMPQMSGLEVALYLQENHPDLKTIVYSMIQEGGTIHNLLEAGVKGYIQKSSDIDILPEAVLQIINSSEVFLCPDTIVLLSQYYTSTAQKDWKTIKPGERTIEVLRYMAQGFRSKEIAERMHTSIYNVNRIRRGISELCGTSNTVIQIKMAVNMGYLSESEAKQSAE